MDLHKHVTKKKKIMVAGVVLTTLTALLIWYFVISANTLEGVVEATIMPQNSEVSGKILEMNVEPGQHVNKGDIVAVIDSTDQGYTLEQLEITLTKKKAAYSELERGAEEASIRQAGNNVDIAGKNYSSAVTTHDQAAADLKEAVTLYKEGAISKAAYDQAVYQETLTRNAMAAAKNQVASANEAVTLLQNGASEEKLTTASADVAQTELQIRQLKEDLEKFTIKASASGTVISRNYVIGDMISPGYNLADLSDDNQRYLVAYLPENKLNSIEYGKVMSIEADGTRYDAKVSFIDVQAEYTPKDLQTAANKNQDSFKVKLKLSPDVPLKPGEKAKLYLDN